MCIRDRFQAGMTMFEGGNAGALFIMVAFAFAAAEGLGIVEEL